MMNLKKIDGTGVVFIVSHLLLAVLIIGAYLYSVIIGHPDETLKNLCIMALSYFFGAVGTNTISTITQSKKDSTNTKDPSNNG